MAETVPAGIDAAGVARFFAAKIEGGDAELSFRLLPGGRSNLTYLVEAGESRWVLRRQPLGHVLPTAHDMRREYRVLAALADTDVPSPRPLALCEDATVTGSPFYVMEYCGGWVANEDDFPPGICDTPQDRRMLSMGVVDALAKLHTIDPAAVGLEGFGRPEGFLERQLRRWREQWERSRTRELPELDELVGRLRAALPESPRPTIVHGDYRLGNMAVDWGPAVGAIFDWEMATLGDPLTDLGWLLTSWGEVGDADELLAMGRVTHITAKDGFLTRAQLAAEYARRTGIDTATAEWYMLFAYFKRAVIIEGIWARYLAGETVGEGFERFDQAPDFVRHALALAGLSEDARLRDGR
ncbi:MAG: phosphotransferase family protein [Tepidiformaceae bacterium]